MEHQFLYDQLVLHVPHASTFIPHGFTYMVPPVYRSRFPSVIDEIKEFSYYLIDYYTDEMFVPEEKCEQIRSIVFDWNRVLCDVERLPKDPLEAYGCGIFSYHAQYDLNDGLKWLKSMECYVEHQNQLATLITSLSLPPMCDRQILLIDCHSFSMHSTALSPNPPADIDICIGYNEDDSKPQDTTIDFVEQFFLNKGYRTARNRPFSNSKTVPVPVQYHSIMIEVNKMLYMNEETLQKTDGFAKLQADLRELYNAILNKNVK